jgi:hypothetical protein
MTYLGTSYDPETLNLLLDGVPGAYSAPTSAQNSGGAITLTSAVIDASGGSLLFDMSQGVSTIIPQGQSSPALDSYLCAPRPKPVIVQVRQSNGTHPHYVLVWGKDAANNYYIIDPGRQSVNSLSAYGTQFQIMGAVKKANGDPSALAFGVVDTATLLVTAPDGSRTGFDPVSGQVLKGWAQSEYFVQDNSIDTDAETVDATSTAYSVEYTLPPDGTYTVQLVGLQSGTYQLAISAYDVNGAHENYVVKPGVAAKGSSSVFQVKFFSVSGSVATVTRTATFASTLADIATSVAVGLIDNAGIADALGEKINEAASAAAEGESDDAREVLHAFEAQISAQAGKHITGIAPQILEEDADFLISSLPPSN